MYVESVKNNHTSTKEQKKINRSSYKLFFWEKRISQADLSFQIHTNATNIQRVVLLYAAKAKSVKCYEKLNM